MWTWEAFTAWAIVVTPDVSVVSVDINSFELFSAFIRLSLESIVAVLSLQKHLSGLFIMVHDSPAAISIKHWNDEILVSCEQVNLFLVSIHVSVE